MPRISRPFILHLTKSCPEARAGLAGWQSGELTFEEAMMEVVKSLFITKENLQRRLDYIPPSIREEHLPPA